MHVYYVYCIALPIALRYILALLILSSLDIFHLNYEVTIIIALWCLWFTHMLLNIPALPYKLHVLFLSLGWPRQITFIMICAISMWAPAKHFPIFPHHFLLLFVLLLYLKNDWLLSNGLDESLDVWGYIKQLVQLYIIEHFVSSCRNEVLSGKHRELLMHWNVRGDHWVILQVLLCCLVAMIMAITATVIVPWILGVVALYCLLILIVAAIPMRSMISRSCPIEWWLVLARLPLLLLL